MTESTTEGKADTSIAKLRAEFTSKLKAAIAAKTYFAAPPYYFYDHSGEVFFVNEDRGMTKCWIGPIGKLPLLLAEEAAVRKELDSPFSDYGGEPSKEKRKRHYDLLFCEVFKKNCPTLVTSIHSQIEEALAGGMASVRFTHGDLKSVARYVTTLGWSVKVDEEYILVSLV